MALSAKDPSWEDVHILGSSDAPAGVSVDTKLLWVSRLSLIQLQGVETPLKHKTELIRSHK